MFALICTDTKNKKKRCNDHIIKYYEKMIDDYAKKRIYEICHRFNVYQCHIKSAQYRKRDIIKYKK